MVKNQQNVPYVVIVAIVALVAIVVLVLNGGNSARLEGNVALANGDFPETYVAPCEDTDPGNAHDILGVARHGHRAEVDYCDGDELVQFTCVSSNTLKRTSAYLCPNGCGGGVCL
jgi:hypothetical protein